MSRHTLEQRDKTLAAGCLEIVIGWDPPLGTYFVQVFDPAHDESEPGFEVLWRGIKVAEFLSPDVVIALVTPWAVVPPDLRGALTADRDADT